MFSIIHISDLHLCIAPERRSFSTLQTWRPSRHIDVVRSGFRYGARSLMHPASYHPTRLEALSEFIYDQAEDADCVIVSGDLATSGTVLDLSAAFTYVHDRPTKLWSTGRRPVLARGNCPLIIVPGNHDHYNGNLPTPNPSNFALKFAPYLQAYGGGRVSHDLFFKDEQALCVICGDLTFKRTSDAKNVAHLYGGGSADAATLRGLRDRTYQLRAHKELANYDLVFLWVIHFAPFDCGADLQLTNFDDVITYASSADVSKIICGHTHRSKSFKDGSVEVFCAGSATAVDCSNVVHILDIDEKPGFSKVTNFPYSLNDRAFVEPHRAS